MKDEVHQVLSEINKAWRSNNPQAISDHLHPDIIMKLPGFSGEIIGRNKLLSSFVEFCTNAKVLEYREADEQIDIIEDCAIVAFQFDMLYERAKYRERSKGRDLWVFRRFGGKWLGVWRTMIELEEVRTNK
jgi:hypothetical protein